MNDDKPMHLEPLESCAAQIQAEQGDEDLARLLWTVVILRRMRSRAIRSVKAENLAPMAAVVARQRLRASR
jgi:hypothetical protein